MKKTFQNLNDLEKNIGKYISDALYSEAQRLQKYLIEEINDYYQSYQPTVYKRTGKWLESIRINPPQMIGNTISISITFDDSLAYHDSIFGGEKGYVPWLFEVGWHWKKDKTFRPYRLADFEGIQYIKKSVERWNKDNKFGFSISVYRGDKRYI